MYRARSLLFNAATFVPGFTSIPVVRSYLSRRETGTGGTDSARYCYSVWLRHLVKAAESGLNTRPRVIAELGPGDSLGTGLAGLLSGCSRYYALDVVSHVRTETNIEVLHELVELFGRRADIPDDSEFPNMIPRLRTFAFPGYLFTDMASDLARTRVREIEASLRNGGSRSSTVQYFAPWSEHEVIDRESVDMLFSQAVLEHVDKLSEAYRAMSLWVKPGGFISHSVDFKSHDSAPIWNGHWAISNLKWALIRGKRSWLLNRQPFSAHLKFLNREGFEIVCEEKLTRPSVLLPHQLAKQFKDLSPADLTTSDVFYQATKKASG
jgi:hypothetical protein